MERDEWQLARQPGDDRSGPRPLFLIFPQNGRTFFTIKPVRKRVTDRDNLVLKPELSRAAGDMGLEMGLVCFFESGGTWQVEANGNGDA
jgi:hypothetical protein